MRNAANEVEQLATTGLAAPEVDQFFRLAGTMVQNLNIERYGPKSRFSFSYIFDRLPVTDATTPFT